ncbi:MAG TPA: hypothetical protein PLO69_13220 [Gammaproteobacteria bacterium]|nr:hypothetical protein [Gammaproteobacteria bacterium]
MAELNPVRNGFHVWLPGYKERRNGRKTRLPRYEVPVAELNTVWVGGLNALSFQ